MAKFLKEKIVGTANVTTFRDNHNGHPIPIGQFGETFYSTIGAFDLNLQLPNGLFEFAAFGKLEWLPNAVASSIYWLNDRSCTDWPLFCEDVVKHNARSTYRHMAYVPSPFGYMLSTNQNINWLLGVPITDKQLGLSKAEIMKMAQSIFPSWLFRENA